MPKDRPLSRDTSAFPHSKYPGLTGGRWHVLCLEWWLRQIHPCSPRPEWLVPQVCQYVQRPRAVDATNAPVCSPARTANATVTPACSPYRVAIAKSTSPRHLHCHLQPRINRICLQCKCSQYALVHTLQWLLANEAFDGFYA